MAAQSLPVSSSPEAPLLPLIHERIRKSGPLSVADYMSLALDHPDFGYYRTQDPFGAAGDFITAPDISQVFGELLGLWLATAWVEAGRPSPCRLVELGPGRGQLMADLLRAAAGVEGFLAGADIHMVESSERLRAVQRQALPDHHIVWHDRIETVPEGPLFLIGNEFLDALPAHQLIRTESGWAERLVSVEDDGSLGFSTGAAPTGLLRLIAESAWGNSEELNVGDIAEVSPARDALAEVLGHRLASHGGVALLVDYGAWVDHPTGDTLQAVHNHQAVDPLCKPGLTDLTTQIDFQSLGKAGARGGASVFGPVPQGTFLRGLGIEPRMAALLKNADDEQRLALRGALFRLTDASAMGEVFKVMVLASPRGPLPPGFHAPTLPPAETGAPPVRT